MELHELQDFAVTSYEFREARRTSRDNRINTNYLVALNWGEDIGGLAKP